MTTSVILPSNEQPPGETCFLNPGEWALGGPGDIIGTLLGSCVSLILWHPLMRLGAMCHYVLPFSERAKEETPDARYGVDAFDLMSKALRNRGVDIRQCVVKMFGGGKLFETGEELDTDVGARNVQWGRRLIDDQGLTLASRSTGGAGWRRIAFDVSTGEVWVRFSSIQEDTL